MQVENMMWLIVAVVPDMYRMSSAVQPSCVQVIIFSDDVDILGLPFGQQQAARQQEAVNTAPVYPCPGGAVCPAELA